MTLPTNGALRVLNLLLAWIAEIGAAGTIRPDGVNRGSYA
jgi:hypothetical protein